MAAGTTLWIGTTLWTGIAGIALGRPTNGDLIRAEFARASSGFAVLLGTVGAALISGVLTRWSNSPSTRWPAARYRFPHCHRRAADCELDHIRAWADGGDTTADKVGVLWPRRLSDVSEVGARVGPARIRWSAFRGLCRCGSATCYLEISEVGDGNRRVKFR